MKFLHISDLHFGKVIHGTSMLENGDQPTWVDRFIGLAGKLRPDAVLIAGDVYDRSSPSGEAVTLFSRLVEELASLDICVLITAGNHDSGQRLAFASSLLAKQKVFIAGTVEREMLHVTLEDEYGPVVFWLMPYIFPAAVSQVLGDGTIHDYDTAARRLIEAQEIDPSVRNVMIAHQNVTAFGREAQRGGSESSVGGVGQIDFGAFDVFDYTALGHIHAAYPVGRDQVRYAGSPMCYHFNETRQAAKGPLFVELGAKGTPVQIRTEVIEPLHPMREMKGTFEELRENELSHRRENEYLRLVVTDQPMTPEISDFFQSLAEQRGSILMERVSEYRRFTGEVSGPDMAAVREKSVEELFADFFAERTGGEELELQDLELLQQAGQLLRSHHPDPGQRDAAAPDLADALIRHLAKQEVKNA